MDNDLSAGNGLCDKGGEIKILSGAIGNPFGALNVTKL
jgi:hypothetical protein